MALFHLVCEKCGKNFTHTVAADIKWGRMRFCSDRCKNRKYLVDEFYFSKKPLSSDKLFTLGQLIATCEIMSFKFLNVISDLKTIEKISADMNITYPIQKAARGLYRIEMCCPTLIAELIDLGVNTNYLLQDVPPYDVLDGMLSTHCFSIAEDGVRIFRTNRSKIALFIQDKYDGKLVTQTYKDTPKGIIGCEWVVLF